MANLNFNGIIRGGVIRSMQILGYGANPNPNPPGPTPLQVSSSVRFNSSDSAYISYTPTLQGSRTTWTWSAWIKRSGLSTIQNLFAARSGSESTFWRFDSSNVLVFYTQNSAGTGIASYSTVAVLRDVSAWYHVLLAIDTTQSTAANRVIMYINGVQQTLTTSTTVSQYTQLFVNGYGYPHAIGLQPSIGEYFNGYMADINFVDGQALTPSAFTETDTATGQLIPLTYAGSYGVNGFYLPFGNGATVAELGFNPKTTAQDYPYWPYNTLLINSSSTNGAQNNTFLDSSTNNFAITRNGNTTQGNFTPFTFGGGTTQADGYYSGYFDGTGDYLTVANNAALTFDSGDFTIETWIYPNALSTAVIAGKYTTSPNTGWSFELDSSGFPNIWIVGTTAATSSVAVRAGMWNHIAVTRSGTALKIFVNGVQTASATNSTNINSSGNALYINSSTGSPGALGLNSYYSNFRIVKGTAVYTANFTVPTTPLTNITNTSLLTCQSSQFIDNSTNAFAVTANGNSQPLPTNPFGMTAWSGYFDGTGDYLTVPSATATTLDADFTIEYFMYRPAAGNNWMLTLGDAFLSSGIETYIGTSGTAFNLYSANAVRITSSTLPAVGDWSHVAMVRSGSTVTLYLNGVSLGTWTSSATFSGITYIGAERYNGSITGVFTGYLSNVRIVKGTAVYTSNFTPPTAPLTAISGTSLLTCQSSTFVDNSTNAFAITVNGNSYTLTLNNPFNSPVNTTPPVQGWSNYYDGGANSLTVAANTALDLTGNFTIEFWAWAIDTSTNYMCNGTQSGSGCWRLQMVPSTGQVLWSLAINSWAGVNISSPTGVFSPKQWVHFAVTRSGNDHKVFVNGIVVASTTVAGSLVNTGRITQIGYYTESGGTFYSKCYFSNLRIIKGTALYTANFAPPTAPLTAVQNTTLLTCQSSTFVDNSIINSTITRSGSPSISTLSPFIPTQSYTAASYGGTMYFDGTGDNLTVPNNAAFQFGSGNFTIEFWAYFNSVAIGLTPLSMWATNQYQFSFYTSASGVLSYYLSSNGTTWNVASAVSCGSVSTGNWVHVALVRNGNIFTPYINGVAGTTTTSSATLHSSTALLSVGSGSSIDYFNGLISNARILKGTALYTTPFVPPVLPLTNITNTSLLLNATNSGIYDATGENVIETVGNAQVSTAVKKWGESSVYFDGTGDYLIIPPNIQNYFSGAQTTGSNKDFTIEFWFYSVNTSISATLLLRRASAGPLGIAISQLANAQLFFGFGDTDQGSWNVTYTSSSNVFTVNTWNHIAATRLGTTYRFFLNGVQIYTAAPSAFVIAGDTLPMYIATNGTEASQFPFNGYIQDFRLTIGAARYQGAFTPPTAAFAYNQYDICNQQLLPANISVTAGIGQDNLADSPSDYGTDTGAGGQVRGNYATMNALRPSSYGAAILTNGSLNAAQNTTAYVSSTSTVAVSSGKWYWEVTCGVAGFVTSIGITSNPAVNGITAGIVTYHYDGTKYIGATNSAYGAAYTNNNVIGFALDLDAGTLVCYKNGVSQGTLTSGLSGTYYAYTTLYGSNNVNFNFGQRAFSYAAPTGFKCLVSTNLPTPTIGATSSTQASDYFDVAIWTGADTATGRSISGLQFAPDLWWSKIRSTTYYHQIFDAVRGAGSGKALASNVDGAEGIGAAGTYGYLSSFDSTGVTYTRGSAGSGTNPDGYAYYDQSSATYVAWAWKANGANVTNTSGTITSTVSANTTSGFSIVKYTGNGNAASTVGHGLAATPSLVIVKNLTSARSWLVRHSSLSSTQNLVLDTTVAAVTLSSGTTYGGVGVPTSTTFGFVSGTSDASNVNASANDYIAYCFAAISGYSAFGAYTGNGSADGPFVYCGFRPAFVMIKAYSGGDAATSEWVIEDRARNTYNLVDNKLAPSSEVEENNTTYLGGAGTNSYDFLSNGFKCRSANATTNQSSTLYIYCVFAESPFKYARAR